MKNIIIIGASGFGREVAWVIERINRVTPTWTILGFLDDDENIIGKTVNGYRVLGKTSEVKRYCDSFFVCAVGASRVRETIINRIKTVNPLIQFGTVIDPSALISEYVEIGEGTIICANTIVTVNVHLGKHVIINLGCTVGHDAILDDYVTLYPSVNVSGMTRIGHAAELGTGMQIIQGKSVGDYSVVGAGAVVIRNIPERCTAVGNPAKIVKN